jgi:hypothetical protein
MVTLLDMIIGLLSKDVNERIDEEIDFLRQMMLAIIGAVLAAMNGLRDSLLTRILNTIGLGQQSMLRRCLPLDELITVLVQAIQHPVNGLVAKISRLATDWTLHIKAEIYVTNNCKQLQRDEDEVDNLEDIIAQIDEDIALYRTQPGNAEEINDLQKNKQNIQRQINRIENRVSINNGMPLVGRRGCYLQKIEFIQKLRFYRNIIKSVIRGLESGILCASLTPDELATAKDPLDDLRLNEDVTIPDVPLIRLFPTPEEIIQLYQKDYGVDGELADALHKQLLSDDDILTGGGVTGDPEDGTGADQLGLTTQMNLLESLASCTQVMDDELIEQLVQSMKRLEQ